MNDGTSNPRQSRADARENTSSGRAAAWDRAHGWDPEEAAGHREPVDALTIDDGLPHVTCPTWCEPNWHAEFDKQDRVVVHGGLGSAGFLPEVHRGGTAAVTRPEIGTWDVRPISTEVRFEAGYQPDSTVRVEMCLRSVGDSPVEVDLLPGEALQLAEALTRAARTLTFGIPTR